MASLQLVQNTELNDPPPLPKPPNNTPPSRGGEISLLNDRETFTPLLPSPSRTLVLLLAGLNLCLVLAGLAATCGHVSGTLGFLQSSGLCYNSPHTIHVPSLAEEGDGRALEADGSPVKRLLLFADRRDEAGFFFGAFVFFPASLHGEAGVGQVAFC